jgi:ubiquinone/menaquinone biosynthesis C-methylase UbiE
MSFKGDSEKQALLRDQSIKKMKKTRKDRYVSGILAVLKPQMKLLDIGCGTAHIIQELAMSSRNSLFVGLDVSPAMVKIAKSNTMRFRNIKLVEGDGFRLPFPSCIFDVVITRLADYSQKEAYRVLRRRGYFFEYGLGPDADKEIKEFFPERIEEENFFFPKDLKKWKQEVSEDIVEAGFTVSDIDDYKEANYHENEEELMDLIEMVPLVRKFDRKKDREKIKGLTEKYGSKKGVKTTWHYYILMARKS